MGSRAGWVLAAALAGLVLPAARADAWHERGVRESPRGAVATCLRASGAPGVVGLLGPLEGRTSSFDVLDAGGDGFRLRARLRPGTLDECPAIASNATGTTVVAGVVRRGAVAGRVVASVGDAGSGFSPPVTVANTGLASDPLTVAVSPRGDVLLAWVESLGVRNGAAGATRVMAVRRAPGGRFTSPVTLSPRRRLGRGSGPQIAAGMNAAGTATVAWAQPAARRRAPNSFRVETSSASPSGPFHRTLTVHRLVQDVNTMALAVAPDGRTLLAYDGLEALHLLERAPGAARFQALAPIRGSAELAADPRVAMLDDGAAVVAWRTGTTDGDGGGVQLATRRSPGPFGPARTLAEPPSNFSEGDLLYGGSEGAAPPLDQENRRLSLGLGSDGRFAVAWSAPRHLPFHDAPLAARAVSGELGGTLGHAQSLGCPCRSVNGLAATPALRGPAVLFTDNVTDAPFGGGLEVPSGGGRLHLVDGGPPAATAPRPPVLALSARRQVLVAGEPVRIRARCDRACDLRALVPGRRHRAPRALATASLAHAGAVPIELTRSVSGQLAPRRPGRIRIVVRAYAPNTTVSAARSIRVFLRRRRLHPLPAPFMVRALRRGSSLVVAWRYPRPARHLSFAVEALRARKRPFYTGRLSRVLPGKGRRRFQVQIRLRRRDHVRFASVRVIEDRPPGRQKAVTVPVVGR